MNKISTPKKRENGYGVHVDLLTSRANCMFIVLGDAYSEKVTI
jgi:hypothetical protein